METPENTNPSSESKQITIDVPAERLAEFYAFFGHFLAGGPGRRRRHGGPHGCHRGHHCGSHRSGHGEAGETETRAAAPGSGTQTV